MKKKILLSVLFSGFSLIVCSQSNIFPANSNVGIGIMSPWKPSTVTGTINTWKCFLTQGYDGDLTGQGGYVMWNYNNY